MKMRCKNIGATVVGVLLILPAILLGPLAKLLPINTSRPYVDGVVINCLRAYKKYNTRSWIRRLVFICQNPSVVEQYLKILSTKKAVTACKLRQVKVADLRQLHDVQTTHTHHRKRVADLKAGQGIDSEFGNMIVVDDWVFDGNHRLAAMREANVKYCTVEYYTTKELI
jgi:hypothetical protein